MQADAIKSPAPHTPNNVAYSNSEVLDVLDEMPHGGGEHYGEEEGKLHPDAADVTVSTLPELEEAAGPDHVVHVDSDIEFGSTEIDIGRSTLVGDRGWDGSEGALLSTGVEGYTGGGTGSDRPYTMLYSTATEGAPRVTGLRLRGASHDREEYAPNDPEVYPGNLARAITLQGEGGEVDNCEIWGWTWAGVHVKGCIEEGRWTDDAHVHHCHLHTSKQDGYGYGIDVWMGFAEIDHVYVNDQRHAIAGQGRYRCGYRARELIAGPDQLSHTIDMHCLTENDISYNTTEEDPDFGLRAGGTVEVRDSTFLHDSAAVATCRGQPWERFELVDCRISHDTIPEYNSGNDRVGSWYQQNVHGVTGNDGERYDPLAPDGEFTERWNTSGNETGASDPGDAWSPDVGASIDFESPADSPAYRGYGDPED